MGKVIAISSMILFVILDIFSLVLLAGTYGLGWAFVSLFVVPSQLFVPFLVGTWIPMLILIATGFFGFYLDSRSAKLLKD